MTYPQQDTGELDLDLLTDEEAERLLFDAVSADEGEDESGDASSGISDDPDDPDDEDDDPRVSRARQQAVKYRQRLRDTEAERDALREELSGHRTNEIVRLAEQSGMRSGADLLAVTSLEALRDAETGRIDPEKVAAAARDAVSSRPHWAAPAKLPSRPQERLRGTGEDGEPAREPSWGDLLGGRQ